MRDARSQPRKSQAQALPVRETRAPIARLGGAPLPPLRAGPNDPKSTCTHTSRWTCGERRRGQFRWPLYPRAAPQFLTRGSPAPLPRHNTPLGNNPLPGSETPGGMRPQLRRGTSRSEGQDPVLAPRPAGISELPAPGRPPLPRPAPHKGPLSRRAPGTPVPEKFQEKNQRERQNRKVPPSGRGKAEAAALGRGCLRQDPKEEGGIGGYSGNRKNPKLQFQEKVDFFLSRDLGHQAQKPGQPKEEEPGVLGRRPGWSGGPRAPSRLAGCSGHGLTRAIISRPGEAPARTPSPPCLGSPSWEMAEATGPSRPPPPAAGFSPPPPGPCPTRSLLSL